MDGMLIYHKAYKTRGVKRNFSTVSTRCFVYYWLYFLYLTPWKHSSVKNLNYDVSSKNNYGVPLSMVGIASTECKNKFMTTFLMYENIFFDGLCTFFFFRNVFLLFILIISGPILTLVIIKVLLEFKPL